MRCFYSVCVIFLAFAVVGCSSLMKEQEWSQNYALDEGVEATSSLMVDGNKRTIGETALPIDSEGSTQYTEAVIKLPKERSIRRIVIHTTNLENFVVYAATDEGRIWKPLQEIKNNQEKKLDISVLANTDQIKIRVRKTSDDERIPRGRSGRRSVRHANGKIQEIEIYGLVEKITEQEAELVFEEVEGIAVPATFTTPASDTSAQAAPTTTSVGISKQKAKPKPKAPPAAVSLESSQDTYALADPIPVTVNIRIGPDDLVVLEDQAEDEMLVTKLLVKNASGEIVECSKPAPRLSPTRPYRASGRSVDVRNAKTLDADSVVVLEIPNLLEYYPITEPGSYTVQFSMQLAVYTRFVGRYQTQIEDLQSSIRDISSNPALAQSDKASVVNGMKEEINQLKQEKGHRYIVAGIRGKALHLSSNALELVIQ